MKKLEKELKDNKNLKETCLDVLEKLCVWSVTGHDVDARAMERRR